MTDAVFPAERAASAALAVASLAEYSASASRLILRRCAEIVREAVPQTPTPPQNRPTSSATRPRPN